MSTLHITTKDLPICGYLPKYRDLCILILGTYKDVSLNYHSIVTYGVNTRRFQQYSFQEIKYCPCTFIPEQYSHAIWLQPDHMATIEYWNDETNVFRLPVLRKITFIGTFPYDKDNKY